MRNVYRAYALKKHRSLTLHATINLPAVDQDPSNSTAGFIYLVNLYRPFNDTFIGLWNKSRTDCSPFTLARLQGQLTDALPAFLNTTESQAADLRTSQQWLRTMVWQLSIANGFLSSTSPDTSMTFTFPIEIARNLVAVTGQFSKQSMEIHGIGLVRIPLNLERTSSPHTNSHLSDRENLRRRLHPRRRHVLCAHRVPQIRARTAGIPQPASAPHLHPARRRGPLPPARPGQDPRHAACDRLGAAAAIGHEDGQRRQRQRDDGKVEAGIEV